MAANNRGIQLVGALIQEYGLDVVHAYMTFIQVQDFRFSEKLMTHLSLRS